jgi:4-hydroxybenzoate polyprenyltransferase
MATLRDFMQLGRTQTACAEGAVFPLIAYLGGAPLWTLPLFALIGFLVHVGGFAENGMSDLKYDRTDPNKSHHPVVAGRIPTRSGWIFAEGVFAAGAILFFALALYRGAYLAMLPFAGFLVFARAYNFLGKSWKPGAVLSISLCFSLSPLACGMLWTDRISPIVFAVFLFAFALEAFQIAVSGEIKDVGQMEEKNLLRDLGARLTPGGPMNYITPLLLTNDTTASARGRAFSGDWFYPGLAAFVLAGVLTLAKILTLEWVASVVVVSWSWPGGFLWILMSGIVGTLVLAVGYLLPVLAPGPFDRGRRVRTMGLGEAAGYLLLVLVVSPLLLPWLWLPFVVVPVLWYAGFNRAIWSTGSAWAPGV